jgi:hypothetical protein
MEMRIISQGRIVANSSEDKPAHAVTLPLDRLLIVSKKFKPDLWDELLAMSVTIRSKSRIPPRGPYIK